MKIWIFICLSISILSIQCYAVSLSDVRVKPLSGTVALTFDDGPSPIYTPKVLAILKENHIKATFFVMGWAAKKYPALIRQMIAQGHAVANHTNSHKDLTRLSSKQLYAEVVGAKEKIRGVLGKPPVCLRPPYGKGNKRVAAYIRQQGMVMVPMGFNSFDYENRGVDRLVKWVVSNAKPGRVFLLHDGYSHRQQTVTALPKIIAGIRKKGLGFSAICYP